MFAYCLNNPVLLYDPSGAVARISKDMSFTNDGLWGQSGYIPGLVREPVFDLSGYICDAASAVADFVGNTNEATTYQNLEDHGFAFYKNTLVIQIPGENGIGLSYGVIILDQYYTANEFGIKTLRHEYGHRAHMNQIGFVNYTITTAIPSLIGAGLDYVGLLGTHYFSLPWEYVADCYGGVNRGGYESWASDWAGVFWYYTLVVAEMTGGI